MIASPGLTSTRIARPPAASIMRAAAAPNPDPPPVMRAVFPSIRIYSIDAAEKDGLTVLVDEPPACRHPEQGRYRALRRDQGRVQIIPLQQGIPAALAFEDLEIVLGDLLAEEIGTAVDENLLARIEMKGQ